MKLSYFLISFLLVQTHVYAKSKSPKQIPTITVEKQFTDKANNPKYGILSAFGGSPDVQKKSDNMAVSVSYDMRFVPSTDNQDTESINFYSFYFSYIYSSKILFLQEVSLMDERQSGEGSISVSENQKEFSSWVQYKFYDLNPNVNFFAGLGAGLTIAEIKTKVQESSTTATSDSLLHVASSLGINIKINEDFYYSGEVRLLSSELYTDIVGEVIFARINYLF